MSSELPTTLIVSNLPPNADAEFLQTLFDGHVQKTVWVGSGGGGSQRFVFVSFDDDAYARRVVENQRAYRRAKDDGSLDALQSGRGANRRKRSRHSAADEATRAATGADSGGGGGGEIAAAPTAGAPSSSTTPQEVQPFFGTVLCKGTVYDRVLYIVESPTSVNAFAVDVKHEDEPQRRDAERGGRFGSQRTAAPSRKEPGVATADRPRHAHVDHSTEAAPVSDVSTVPTVSESATVVPGKVKGRSTAIPSFSEAKKQSTRLDADDASDDDIVLTRSGGPRPSSGDDTNARGNTNSVGRQQMPQTTPVDVPVARVSAVSVERKRSHPQGVLESTASPLSSPPDAEVKATPAAAAAAAATAPTALFPRSSKDQCKFCGSEQHLSRHCPSKQAK